jgi:hypothetical protein
MTAQTTQTNQQIITAALNLIGVVADGRAPTPTQSSDSLTILNDNMLTQQRDGWNLGWYPQTIAQLNSAAPILDESVADVKYCLCAWLAPKFAVKIPVSPDPMDESALSNQIKNAFRRLNKRSLLETESDLGELSRPQGGPWGGPNYL